MPEATGDEPMSKGVITTGAGATDKTSVAFADCAGTLESVAVIANTLFPLATGVPEMMPALAERLSPAGSCPPVTLHV